MDAEVAVALASGPLCSVTLMRFLRLAIPCVCDGQSPVREFWGNHEGHLAQRRRAINKWQLSLRLSVSAGKSPPSRLPGGGDIGTLRRNSEGHLAQRRRGAEQRTNGNPLRASASPRANRPHRGYPVAVTQELYGAITNGNFYLAVPSWCSVVPGWGQVPGLCGHRGGRAGMPGLHLRTDHVFRLAVASPSRGGLCGA